MACWSLTAAGGIIGCLILAFLPSSSFEHVVPFLIFLAAVMMMVSGKKKQVSQTAQPTKLWVRILKNSAIFFGWHLHILAQQLVFLC